MMNRLSQVVLISALILSGYSSASFASSYYFFLKEGTQPSGSQVGDTINIGNTGGTFTLTVPETLFEAVVSFTVQDTLVTSQVFLEKNGECLDQGVNHVGLNQMITSTPGYTLEFTVNASATSKGCVDGNPPPIRTAKITRLSDNEVVFDGYYHVYNLASQSPNSVPEPASLALLGLGLGALVLAGRRKAKRT